MNTKSITEIFIPFEERMHAECLPKIVIDTFKHHYTQLFEGNTGSIEERDICPVDMLPDTGSLDHVVANAGEKAVSRTVLIKLNGGLGTSMGLNKAKSLIKIKDDMSFLDIIARQAIQSNVPLILMNSFATRDESLAALEQYPELRKKDIGLDFIQHKVPKINREDLSPVLWPQDPNLEWSPPGHGDIYTALVTSGMLERLLVAGYEYAFISNSDNLGAVLDTHILGYFTQQQIPFMMEVADRTEADKKGGHLARRPDGQLILRESAQCRLEDKSAFQDVTRHKYFNTNNLWLNLKSLKNVLVENGNILGLPFICNTKTVDPKDEKSIPVYQLETAMGSAIAVFKDAQAIRVPRTRFAPVKTTNDLLVIRSDAYALTDDYRVLPDTSLSGPIIDLDTRYYKQIDDLEARFPGGVPSLIHCSVLNVKGDIKFGGDVTVKGNVHLENNSGKQVSIKNDSIVENTMTWN